MLILYIETNFLMAIAKGQDLPAQYLLSNPPDSVSILIPNICCIEAISTYRQEEKNGSYLQHEMKKKMIEVERDKTSPHAQDLYRNLMQARISHYSLINDIKSRLFDAIVQINTNTKIIHIDDCILHNICQLMLNEADKLLIKNDIMDNLILQCILNHANSHPQKEKAFISNNTKDFGQPEVKEALRDAGVKYFTITQHFFDWFNSRSST